MGRFRDGLAGPGLAAIAEIKRRSPSAGDLRPDADPSRLASEFERAGASAVSILVDERFGGTFADVEAARRSTRLPLLAKGFFRVESDLQRAKGAGADAVLLLLRDLDDRLAATLLAEAQRLELDALVEAHDAGELRRAVDLGADPIGLNARDLGSFRIDRGAALELVAAAPRDRLIVAESGLTARAHGAAAELAGADAILVGSALMQASDPAARLAELIARPLVKICAAETPRRAPAVLPVPETMLSVAVYVGELGRNESDLVQLYPREGDHRGRDGVLLRNGERVARVLDLPWKSSDPGHLERARAVNGRVLLAGGLSPENVRLAIAAVKPWAVDASSALEQAPGIKDHARVHAFVEAVR